MEASVWFEFNGIYLCSSGNSYGDGYVTLEVLLKDWLLVILLPSMVLTHSGRDLYVQGQRS